MNQSDSTPTPDPTPTVGTAAPAMPTNRLARRTRRLVAGVAAAGLVVGAVGTVAVTSAVGAEPAATVTADTPGRLAIPPALREDLRGLAAADPEDRPELFRKIIEQAEAGDYGRRALVVAHRIDERLDALPAELRSDIAEVQAAPAEDRPELRQQIRENAEAGGYGADVQAILAELEQAFQDRGIHLRHETRTP
ncbi:hypothetical protein [Microbacterium sp.]|uniref:hypothetical protein n=1 Tax=Microbacterium sp. TaxID=51671 RepID=UPI0025F93D21|nr:hypothetical protein [Microbacterium sp.]